MDRHKERKYIAITLFVLLCVLGFFIVKPFVNAIAAAAVIAVLVNPIYLFLLSKFKKRMAAALTTAILTALSIALPLLAIVNTLIVEASKSYGFVSQYISESGLSLQRINEQISFIPIEQATIQQTVSRAFNLIIDYAQEIVLSVPGRVISFFIFTFTLYYLLKQQKGILELVYALMPLSEEKNKIIITRIKQVTQGVLFGTLLTALIQGVFAGVGYWIFGLEAPILLAVLTAIAAMIPYIGTGLVWVPASGYLFLTNVNQGPWWLGVGLFVYCALFVSTIDNFLKPKLIGQQAKIHPVLALLGILGGLQLFGVIGILVGPLVLSIIGELVVMYKQQSLQNKSKKTQTKKSRKTK